mgnify:CR=1 FL=1
MTKLEQLKVLVRKWEQEKGMAVAYEICEFLSKNLGEGDGRGGKMSEPSLIEITDDKEFMERVLKKSEEMQEEILKKAEEKE